MTASPLAPTATVAEGRLGAVRRRGLGAIEVLLADPAVTDIVVDGPGPILVDRHGRVCDSGFSLSAEGLEILIERLLDPLGLQVDRSRPVVDGRLADGSRLNVVVPPAAVGGPLVTIRRFPAEVHDLVAFGGRSVAGVLSTLVAERASLLVVGATSSGKTSLLNALGACFDDDERIITIEDTAELRLAGGRVVALEARPPNREGVGEVTLRHLVRNALRMRPDRLIVGEVRGPEALDLALALTSGHRGSLATCHASSAEGALHRLSVLARLGADQVPADAVDALFRASFDAVATMARRGAERRVVEIVEVPAEPTRALPVLWAARPRVVS